MDTTRKQAGAEKRGRVGRVRVKSEYVAMSD
jgi:hypothetical protein